MPRKTKEQKDVENLKNIEKELKKLVEKPTKKATKKMEANAKSEKSDTKSVSSKNVAKATEKKTTKSSSKKSAAEKTTKPTSKTTAKKVATTKKSAANKSTVKKTTAKKATANKTTAKKTTANKTTVKKATAKSKKSSVDIVEYYDLPYRYNQTVVKVLAQTPTNLFIYWDISDKDRENYKKEYGENFFETTKPVLIIHNDTLNYSFEVEINDFANSWYLQVNDAKCDYRIELGRRPIAYNKKINSDYICVTTSNEIESPNDRVLFNKDQKMVYFRDIKTGVQTSKTITNFSFIRNMGKIYNIYDMYKEIYKDENIEEIYDLSNPSSGNPSSRESFIKI